EVRGALIEIIGLRLPAEDPANRRESGERGSGRGRVGRLTVIDEEDAVLLADSLHSVGEAGVGAEAFSYGFCWHSQKLADVHRHGRVFSIVGTLERGPVCLIWPSHRRNELIKVIELLSSGFG